MRSGRRRRPTAKERESQKDQLVSHLSSNFPTSHDLFGNKIVRESNNNINQNTNILEESPTIKNVRMQLERRGPDADNDGIQTESSQLVPYLPFDLSPTHDLFGNKIVRHDNAEIHANNKIIHYANKKFHETEKVGHNIITINPTSYEDKETNEMAYENMPSNKNDAEFDDTTDLLDGKIKGDEANENNAVKGFRTLYAPVKYAYPDGGNNKIYEEKPHFIYNNIG